MSSYRPSYDTTIRTSTVVNRHNTTHMDGVDWTYPFDDPKHMACMCGTPELNRKEIERHKGYLRDCEEALDAGQQCFVSNYGGWPRIWNQAIRVCMASCWPYWQPRPVVLVIGALGGTEYYDWMSLTGFKKKETDEDATAIT